MIKTISKTDHSFQRAIFDEIVDSKIFPGVTEEDYYNWSNNDSNINSFMTEVPII